VDSSSSARSRAKFSNSTEDVGAHAHAFLKASKSSGQSLARSSSKGIRHAFWLPHNRRLRASVSFSLGNNHALVALKNAYRAGCVGKEDIAAALRARQAAVDATESPQRKVATEFEILRNRGHSKAFNFG